MDGVNVVCGMCGSLFMYHAALTLPPCLLDMQHCLPGMPLFYMSPTRLFFSYSPPLLFCACLFSDY